MLNPQATLPRNVDTARALLVQQRVDEPGYKPPESHWRNKFRSSRRRESIANTDNWIFSKHEVARTLDGLLSRATIPAPGVAQAVLSHASETSLDDLWSHLHDAGLEKRLSSRFKKTRPVSSPIPAWLDYAINKGDLDYVRLLCQAGLDQASLDRAFGIAMSKSSLVAMEVLLAYGAVASAYKNQIREHVIRSDLPLVKLLLAAPNAMSTEAWQYCIEPRLEYSSSILLLCLANRPDIISASLLLSALRYGNLRATATILAYTGSPEIFHDIRKDASTLATRIEDDRTRCKVFSLLSTSGLLLDGPILQTELMRDVRRGLFLLVRILTDAGVTVDNEPSNAFLWAAASLDFRMLETLRFGAFSSPVSSALRSVSDSTPESDLVRLINIIAPLGVAGADINMLLVRAVEKQHTRLAHTLIENGASVEYDQASAVRVAVARADFNMLGILLGRECAAKELSAAVPIAMALPSRPARLRTMTALVEKGVLHKALGGPLYALVSEDGNADIVLITLLLRHGAPVDVDPHGSSVLAAVRRGDVRLLTMLCETLPSKSTLADAVTLAFRRLQACGYDVVISMITILLRRGASGEPVDHTLMTAVASDDQLDIVRALVRHGAKAGVDTFATALRSANPMLLEILCSGCRPSQAITESILMTAVNPQYFRLQILELLLSSTDCCAIALNRSWSSEKFAGNPNMSAILPCFLRHGLDVNLRNGDVVCFAVREQNATLLRRTLVGNPDSVTLRAALAAAASIQARYVGLEAMKLLLEHPNATNIGQSELLLQETRRALKGDSLGLALLLCHGAVVGGDDGKALQLAAMTGSVAVLDSLSNSGPDLPALSRACLAAAASSMTNTAQKGPCLQASSFR